MFSIFVSVFLLVYIFYYSKNPVSTHNYNNLILYELAKKSAEDGNIFNMANLATWYYTGEYEVTIDYEESRNWANKTLHKAKNINNEEIIERMNKLISLLNQEVSIS